MSGIVPMTSSFLPPISLLPEPLPHHSVLSFPVFKILSTEQNEKDNLCIVAAIRVDGGGRSGDRS